jgi:hypothetical protein
VGYNANRRIDGLEWPWEASTYGGLDFRAAGEGWDAWFRSWRIADTVLFE